MNNGQSSLSSGYASPVPSSSSSQTNTRTGNAVPTDSLATPTTPTLVLDSQVNSTMDLTQLARSTLYVNNPLTGATSPDKTSPPQAFILTPVPAPSLALNAPAENATATPPVVTKDCNAAEVPPQPCQPPQGPTHRQQQQRVSNDYLTTKPLH